MWVIMINKSFLKVEIDHTFNSVSELSKSTLFDSFESANNFMSNHIPKKIRYKYKIVDCDDFLFDDEYLTNIIIENVQNKTIKIIDENIQILSNALSAIDRKQQDILHNIEMTEKFNLYESWLLMNKLKTIRVKRRRIKKCLTTLTTFKNTFNLEQLYLEQSSSSQYTNRIIEDFDEYKFSNEDISN